MVYGCNTCVNRFGYDRMSFPIDAILISSPIIGGVFSNPAVRWPDTLGKLSYLRDHPYFLPCFIPSVLAFIAFLGALVGLKEVFMTVSSFLHFSNSQPTSRHYLWPRCNRVIGRKSHALDRPHLQASLRTVMLFITAQLRTIRDIH